MKNAPFLYDMILSTAMNRKALDSTVLRYHSLKMDDMNRIESNRWRLRNTSQTAKRGNGGDTG